MLSLVLLQKGYLLQPDYLITGIKFLIAGIILTVIAIYIQLYYKKKVYLYNRSIINELESWISETILIESIDSISIPEVFYRIARDPIGNHIIMNELLNCRKSFKGDITKNIIRLYEQLGLPKTSAKKLNNKKWYIKAQGILELYLMDQKDKLADIYKYTNNENDLVRMEAQMGIIHLSGFEGLRFLDNISYPITEWLQINLLEQLRYSEVPEKFDDTIAKWFQSDNTTVIIFALRLAGQYQQLSLHEDIVQCLKHDNEMVREQAIKTLTSLENENTPSILTKIFPQEPVVNKLAILKGLKEIGSGGESAFLTHLLLNDSNNTIKLNAAKALAATTDNGLEILKTNADQLMSPYKEIYLHVKSEMRL
jgi:hypothetical protein